MKISALLAVIVCHTQFANESDTLTAEKVKAMMANVPEVEHWSERMALSNMKWINL